MSADCGPCLCDGTAQRFSIEHQQRAVAEQRQRERAARIYVLNRQREADAITAGLGHHPTPQVFDGGEVIKQFTRPSP